MTETRFVLCEWCGSEGRLYSGHGNDPHPHDDGPCPACKGTGLEEVAVEPITLEDLEAVP
jgi:hypothetical protein